MKKQSLIISILFLVLTLTSSLKIAGTIGYYALFTDDFVERFCENKERPELNCDGKCELSKILLQESNDDTPPINLDFLKTETILFLESRVDYDFSIITENINTINQYTNLYNFHLLEKEFQPPRV
ncbi:hypothetical protein [Maribacter sp. HTCC2170]|uniref:hypothetical protein n=1 Tax=Maribacter sp. (strain HTCC2170 / KCCM 42371) TaxID=313603 RepID=UPI0002F110B8|nr:hypothetical protein [Maribacter sp. HTCC2170]